MTIDSYSTLPIKIGNTNLGGNVVQTINARELHSFLESKQEFANWFKQRVEQYGFAESVDFVCLIDLSSEGRGGQNRKDYAITLDMAKELAMVERNERGKQARQYFIECERRAKQPSLDPANLSRMQLIELAMQAEQERLVLEHKVEEMADDVKAFERIGKADGSLCIRDAAKALQMKEKDLFAWLHAHEWIYRRSGCPHWLGYSAKVMVQLLEHKVTVVNRSDGTEKLIEQVRITFKGLQRLAKELNLTLVRA
jgi:anti-repressor protein